MNTTGRNAEYERDHVRDYRKHDAPVLATHSVWQVHQGEELIAAYEYIAELERGKIALKAANRSARHLLGSYDRYDAAQIEDVADQLDRADRVAT
jgi:hypothetical protein